MLEKNISQDHDGSLKKKENNRNPKSTQKSHEKGGGALKSIKKNPASKKKISISKLSAKKLNLYEDIRTGESSVGIKLNKRTFNFKENIHPTLGTELESTNMRREKRQEREK